MTEKPNIDEKIRKSKFKPYKLYQINTKKLYEFLELTKISYNITQHLLFKNLDEDVELEPWDINKGNICFSMGDLFSSSPNMISGWLTFEEYYAGKYDLDIESARIEVEQKILGPALEQLEHLESKKKPVIIWPKNLPKRKLLTDLIKPRYGFSGIKFKVGISPSHRFNTEEKIDLIQKKYLELAHAMGDSNSPEKLKENSESMLYRSCFILEWTFFEVFLRDTIQKLIRKYPTIITSEKKSKGSLSYNEIFELSQDFSSIQKLQYGIIEKEIEKMEGENQSVHGIINYLKSVFKFDVDPYKAWYIYYGDGYYTSYHDLLEIKNVRNALAHDDGKVDDKFIEKYSNVPIQNNRIYTTYDYYLREKLILNSIAYLISDTIENKKFKNGDCS